MAIAGRGIRCGPSGGVPTSVGRWSCSGVGCLDRRAVYIVVRTCVRIRLRVVIGPAGVGINIGPACGCGGWIVSRMCVGSGFCRRSV